MGESLTKTKEVFTPSNIIKYQGTLSRLKAIKNVGQSGNFDFHDKQEEITSELIRAGVLTPDNANLTNKARMSGLTF